MNHSFIAAKWSDKVCAKCARSESVHSNEVQCESCANIGPVEIIGKILMCESCQSRHHSTPSNGMASNVVEKLSLEQVVNQVNRLLETNAIVNANGDSVKTILDEAIHGNIKEYKDFFNAHMPSINELKELIDADESIKEKHYGLAIALKSRINYLARVLFATRDTQIQIGGEIKSIQFYMSELIPNLRMKLRAEFALNTPNYIPQIIKKNVKQKAKNPQERLAESYAKAMKITIEEARRKLANKLRDDCTCSETPGLCKVHNNIKEIKK